MRVEPSVNELLAAMPMASTSPLDATSERIEAGTATCPCPQCGKAFRNRSALRLHTAKVHSRLHRLPPCSEHAWMNPPRLAGNAIEFICPQDICRKAFRTAKSLLQHYQKSHMERRFECSGGCGRIFALRRDLTYHEKNSCRARKLDAEKEVEAEEGNTVSKATQTSSTKREKKQLATRSRLKHVGTLIPVPPTISIHGWKLILPRLSPAPSISTASTQTEPFEPTLPLLSADIIDRAINTVERGSQSDLRGLASLQSPSQQDSLGVHYCYSGCMVHSFAQTVDAGSMDFGSQFDYPASEYFYDSTSEGQGQSSSTNYVHIETQTHQMRVDDDTNVEYSHCYCQTPSPWPF